MSRRGVQEAIAAAQRAYADRPLVDRVIGYWAPQRAERRAQARAQFAMRSALATGGYTGASKSRRSMSSWTTSGGDADSDTLPDLPTLRERSRDLVRNNALAAGALRTKVGNVVGTGLRLHSNIDADFLGMSEEEADAWERDIEREFRLWAQSQNCDARRTLNFYGLQELAFGSAFENGDVFAVLPAVDDRPADWPYDLTVQLIEADRCCNPRWQRDTDRLSGGVEKSASGSPLRYHFLKRHPGALNRMSYGADAWQDVPAFGARTGRRNVIHLYRSLRIGQTRGVPELAPVIELFKQLGDYTEAEVTAAVVSGLFTVFVKSEAGESLAPMQPTSETGAKSSDDDVKLSSGGIVDLAPGESIESTNPGRPNQAFDPFVQAVLRQVGTALEIPYELLIQHFTASYSAARASLLQAWKFFRARRQWLADYFCQPIYEAWMTEAVAKGRVYAPGFLQDPAIRAAYLGAEWIGPAMGQVDPKKENEADAIAEDRGWKTAAENTAEKTGGDWERKHRQRAKEHRLRVEDGLEPRITQLPSDVPSDEEGQDQ